MSKHLVASICLAFTLTLPAWSQDTTPEIEPFSSDFEAYEGFYNVFWDAGAGKVWLEIDRFNEPFLYLISLPAGLGSNDIGLDRGLLGSERIVHFERIGPKVLLVAPNLDYRSSSENPNERSAVADAFARSTLWGFDIAAETDGRVLVDATAFVIRDAQGITQRISRMDQGSFSLESSRSAINPDVVKSFPDNTEMEAWLTFTGNNPGGHVRSVAAEPSTFTLRARHSLIRLPDGNYEPRPADPRYGFWSLSFADYSVPIGEPLQQRFIGRHRLEKVNPGPAPSRVVEPIVFYLDPGTPEPVRSALLDGARWWSDAFEAAGFVDAYRVEMLPEGADLMDIRYNTIQWVHRSTRGWSYGRSVIDPRTGEIIKGHVSLGSLRVRQDYLIAEGLLAPYDDASGRISDDALQMALARIRQLSAHEVGHTIGLAHNFAASTYGRESVMDYPAPLAVVASDGSIDLTDAYDVGVGEWDIAAVTFGYGDWADRTEVMLDSLLDDAASRDLIYITDSDARPTGGAHPLAHLWDNGGDILDALDRELDVRRVALESFGEEVIRFGEPLALLEEALVPLYLRHRYQIEAVSKLVGGLHYAYSVRGGSSPAPAPVHADLQTRAIDAMFDLLKPHELRLPDRVAGLIPPRPPGFGANRELFDGYSGLTFDRYAPAETASDMVISMLLNPQRAARLIYQHDLNRSQPGLIGLFDDARKHLFDDAESDDPTDAELERMVQWRWTFAVMDLASNTNNAPAVIARAGYHLRDINTWLESNPGDDPEAQAHRSHLSAEIERFLFRQFDSDVPDSPVTTPPGSPIG